MVLPRSPPEDATAENGGMYRREPNRRTRHCGQHARATARANQRIVTAAGTRFMDTDFQYAYASSADPRANPPPLLRSDDHPSEPIVREPHDLDRSHECEGHC